MNQMVPLYAVLLIVAAGGLLWLVRLCVSAISRSVNSLIASNEACSKDLKELAQELKAARAQIDPLLKEAHETMGSIPKLLESVARVGHAQLEVVQQQREEHAARARNPFGRPNAPAPPRDVEAANLEHEVQQMMRAEGVSREEAMMRMNPANTQSVWDGDELTRGWR